jgi:hypothetical protein
MTLSHWVTAINETHSKMLYPDVTVKTSGFFAPLNCFGQTHAINQAMAEMTIAAKKAATAADQTFLVKPVNVPMPQAMSSSRLLVVHNDAAARAAAHLALAVKNLKPYRTLGADGLPLETACIPVEALTGLTGMGTNPRSTWSNFLF